MKLSIKIASIFTIITGIMIILYLVSSNIMVDYLYQGEVTRITGITSGVVNRVEGEKSKLIGKVKDYATMMPNIQMMQQKYQTDIMDEIGMYKKFEHDSIQAKIILSPGFKVKEIYTDKRNKEISQDDLDFIIEELSKHINQDELKFEGIISTVKNPYLVSLNAIENKRLQQVTGYFMGIQGIDNEILETIGNSMHKNIELVNTIDMSKVEQSVKSYGGQPIHLIYHEDSIESYYPVGKQYGEGEFYLKVKEPLVVKESTKKNIDILTAILIILSIIINLILGILVERIVVKRLVKINKQINHINTSKDLSERLSTDDCKDEIGILERDINEMFDSLQLANQHIVLNEAKYSSVLQTMTNGFAYYHIKKDEYGKYIDAICEEFNDALASILGVQKESMIGSRFSELSKNSCINPIQLQEILGQVWRTGKPYVLNHMQISEGKWVDLTLHVIEEGHLAVIINDVTTLKRYSDEMKYLAEYDSLTTLKNRHSLYQYLGRLKEAARPFIIYFMDLDNFKTLNDTVGHIEGDKVLCLIAKELLKLANSHTTVGRLGGDEFIVIREGEFTPQEIMQFGQNILGVVNTKFEYAFYNFTIKASIGVSIYPTQTSDINTLLKYGDIAMYKSKKSGGNSIQIFTDEMMEELEIEVLLKDAIANEEFVPYYQPIFNLKQNKIVGAEVLVRWVRNGEVIPPARFISIAKRTGRIVRIDYMMFDKACEFCKKWHTNGFTDFEISVNMSYRALKRPNCIEIIKEIIDKYQLNPAAVRIEVTEDEILDYPQYIIKVLNRIKELGIKISLDDFGVGYSSFNHIKMLPIDTLKIDRSLLLKIEEDKKTVAIIDTLIKLAHTLDLDVVCEGVEEENQLEMLKRISCDKIQGYYISQPVEEVIFYKCMEHYNIDIIEKEDTI